MALDIYLECLRPFHRISRRFDQQFFSSLVNRQTDIQTDTHENITSLSEVKITAAYMCGGGYFVKKNQIVSAAAATATAAAVILLPIQQQE